jgi:ssDNA-binding Zn-finger/Zn-ribbon topoisomerase 1
MKFQENTEASIFCPNCEPVVKLRVKTNRTTDHQFLGCPNWPECNHTRGIPEEWKMRASGQISLFDEAA